MIKTESSITAQLRKLEERFLIPEMRASPNALAELIADEFTEIGSSGRKFSRQEVVEVLKHEKAGKRSIEEFQSFPLSSDIVLVVYRVIHENKVSLRSSIWKSFDGQWKIVFHQGTVVHGTG